LDERWLTALGSIAGISLLTQVLYAVVFVSRYLDLFRSRLWEEDFLEWKRDQVYLIFFKLFYIVSSLYIIFLMVRVYARTRERERSWKLAGWSVLGSAAGAPIAMAILSAAQHQKYPERWFTEVSRSESVHKTRMRLTSGTVQTMWAFSIILESVCVLPQLVLLRQTTVPTVIDSYYLVTLGSYRALYILNWLVRGFGPEHFWDPIADLFGVIQTLLYLDFAWVYYSRQRVKLRNGGIVDSDDMRKSWLVSRLINPRAAVHRQEDDEAEPLDPEADAQNGSSRSRSNRWGPRGVSVAADDTLHDHHSEEA
jgi:ER lumen protein retaining receptor